METSKTKTFFSKLGTATKEFVKATCEETVDLAKKVPGGIKTHPRFTAVVTVVSGIVGFCIYKSGKSAGKKSVGE